MATFLPPNATSLQQAHAALSAGDNAKALQLFQQAQQERPELAHSISFIVEYLTAGQTGTPLAEHWQHAAPVNIKESSKTKSGVDVLDDVDGWRLDSSTLTTAINMHLIHESYWQSTNSDPYFILDLSGQIIPSGFYRFDINLNVIESIFSVNTKLYIDFGTGFNEQDVVSFTLKPEELASRLIYFKQPVRNIRFDPADNPIVFKLTYFLISNVLINSAVEHMMQYVQNKKVSFPAQCATNHDKLYELYDQVIKNSAIEISYLEWIYRNEVPSIPDDATITSKIKTFDSKPIISVVIPTYNTPEVYLRECIESVLSQSYPYLELCVADDNSSLPHVVTILNECAKKDSRVKIIKRNVNGHISLATNSAIALATGEFIALLDHDDLLAKHALFFVAEAINKHPDGQIFYSDEDKIDLHGRRSEPHFKSSWNPDLFFSQNYVSHLGVYRTNLIGLIGGFRVGVEGSQDQDLLLRCLPFVTDKQIHHIPRVLYHWRMLEGSTAFAAGEKSYSTEAGIKSLTDYFSQNGPAGTVVNAGFVPNTYRVIWPLPEVNPKVTLLIPTRDRKSITEVAVRSILNKTTYPNYEIVILDNGSVELESLDFFERIQKEDKRVSVLKYDYPFNYSAINNFGVKHTNGELIGLINNDIEVINDGWLTEMVRHALRPEIGCVGAKLYYSNGQIQHAGVILGIGGVAGHSHKYFAGKADGYFSRLKVTQNVSAVTAAVLVIRREVFSKVGGLNENDLKVAFNDVDFCLKVKQAGYRNLWTPYAELFHHESISRGHEDTPEKVARFQEEVFYMQRVWKDVLFSDPYYSPHLSKSREDFSIAL